MSSVSNVSANARPVVVADQRRDRRLFLERTLNGAGYLSVCASTGERALRLAREHAAPLLVTHVGVRCGDVPLAFALGRGLTSGVGTKILCFTDRRARGRRSVEKCRGDVLVSCSADFSPVLRAVERLIGLPRDASVRPPDLLVTLMLLEHELKQLSDWWL